MRQRRFVGQASSVGRWVSRRPSTADEVSRGSGSRFPSAPWLRKVAAPCIECKVCLFCPNAAVILEIQKQGGERVEEQATDRMAHAIRRSNLIEEVGGDSSAGRVAGTWRQADSGQGDAAGGHGCERQRADLRRG
ncbi:hypothetical protein VPH35_136634 [Triticum aestivum]